MNMKQSCKALICAIEGELDGRHCTEEQAAAILDHALPSLTEVLARVEAEHADDVKRYRQLLNEAGRDRYAAQKQLAEAVGLLEQLISTGCWDVSNSAPVDRARDIYMAHRDSKLSKVKGDQAEQQEAQGAQAVDERAAFNKEYDAFRQWAGERLTARQLDLDEVGLFYDEIAGFAHDAWQARAALATQPAAREPVAWRYVERTSEGYPYAPEFSANRWPITPDEYSEQPLFLAPPAATGEPVARELLRQAFRLISTTVPAGVAAGLDDPSKRAWWYRECKPTAVAISEYLSKNPAPPAAAHGDGFQARVQPWMLECFGEVIAGDRQERNHRFLEEALELVQSTGCTASEAHQLVDYVFGRPVGEPTQEVGGVMVTLAALCLANGLDMHDAAEVELARIWTKVEVIRAKQAAKPKHSPLPVAAAHGDEAVRKDAERYRWLRERDLDAISVGGVFAGMTPENVVLNLETLDEAIDAAMRAQAGEGGE